MHRVRKNGHAVGQQSANQFNNRETQVQKKGGNDIFCTVVVVVEVSVRVVMFVIWHNNFSKAPQPPEGGVKGCLLDLFLLFTSILFNISNPDCEAINLQNARTFFDNLFQIMSQPRGYIFIVEYFILP